MNADRAKEVGENILKLWWRTTFTNTRLKKTHLVTMAQKNAIVVVDGETLQIDPQLLFQRLTPVAQNMTKCRNISVLAMQSDIVPSLNTTNFFETSHN